MKPEKQMRQLELGFIKSNAPGWSGARDMVRARCSKCGREIHQIDHYEDGALTSTTSDYMGPAGECYDCTFPKGEATQKEANRQWR